MNPEWIRFIIGAVLIIAGLFSFAVSVAGTFKFKYVLNRMHAAGICDTFGVGLTLLGLMVFSGFTFTTLKLLLVVAFLWFSSPTSTHMIARLEMMTGDKEAGHYRIVRLDGKKTDEKEDET